MDSKLKLSYREKNGQLYPLIDLEGKELGRFGRQWMEYMKTVHPYRFMVLHMTGELEEVAYRVEQEALERQEAMYQQMLHRNPPGTEDFLEKARRLNHLRLVAEEFVMKKIVLRPR